MDKINLLIKEDIIELNKNLLNVIHCDNEILVQVKNFLNGSSKRIRSVLTFLYLKAHNALITEQILNIAVATELIHNASLLHDDVIDNADIRRGDITLWKKFSPQISILAGDYLLSEAVEILLKAGEESISDKFLITAQKMSCAEMKQYLLRGTIPALEEYLDIIKGKTAELFSTFLEVSAQLSELNQNEAKKFGEIFGLLFQINNDTDSISIENDSNNCTNTVINILGIEKTYILKDNYKRELKDFISCMPKNKYRQGLEDLVNLL